MRYSRGKIAGRIEAGHDRNRRCYPLMSYTADVYFLKVEHTPPARRGEETVLVRSRLADVTCGLS